MDEWIDESVEKRWMGGMMNGCFGGLRCLREMMGEWLARWTER